MLRAILIVSIIALTAGPARAEDLAKLLDWTFFPGQIITYVPSEPPQVGITKEGSLQLKPLDQDDNAVNSGQGWGFNLGKFIDNTVWDSQVNHVLTVAQPLTLPDGSVPKSNSAWADMTGNVLLLHFDSPPVVKGSVLTYSTTYPDNSASALSASCTRFGHCVQPVPNVRLGGAVMLNGCGSELLVPANPSLKLDKTLTMETWVYPTFPMSSPSALWGSETTPRTFYYPIVSQGGLKTSDGASYEMGMAQYLNQTSVYMKAMVGQTPVIVKGGVLPFYVWSHIVGTYDGSKLVVYINGIPVATQSASGNIVTSDEPLAIGTTLYRSSLGTYVPFQPQPAPTPANPKPTIPNQPPPGKVYIDGWQRGVCIDVVTHALFRLQFGGMVDEVAVFNRAITGDEVKAHYDRQVSPYTPLPPLHPPTVGVFESRQLNAGIPMEWKTLTWQSVGPYSMQLPDNSAPESGYGFGSNSNMEKNILLLHLNEATGATTFTDASSLNSPYTITCSGAACPAMGGVGKFSNGALFDGKDDVITVAADKAPTPTKELSIEAWIYPTSYSLDGNNGGRGIISKGVVDLINNTPADYELVLSPFSNDCGPGCTRNALNIAFNLGGHSYNDPITGLSRSYIYGSHVPLNTWSHVVGTYDAALGAMSLYVNGERVAFQEGVSGGEVKSSVTPLQIGRKNSTLSYVYNNVSYPRDSTFVGKIDEVAVYSRVLKPNEVTGHFIRGAMQVKFQVRACQNANCSDMKFFVGPDGSNQSFFTPSIAPQTPPLQQMDLTKLGFPPSQFFQYRVFLETRYANLNPALQSVQIGPTHYPATDPKAIINTEMPFSQVTGMTDSVTASPGGAVHYQLSPDGKDWFFCAGTKWHNITEDLPVVLTDFQKTNTSAQINNCSAFKAPNENGNIWFKTFFHAPTGTEAVTLNKVSIDYKPPVAPPAPPSPTQPSVVDPGDQTATTTKTLSFVVQATVPNNKAPAYSITAGEKTGMAIDAKTGLFTWTPSAEQVGNFVVTVRVADSTDAKYFTDQAINIAVKSEAVAPSKPADVYTLYGDEGAEIKFALKGVDPAKAPYHFTCTSGCPLGLSTDYTSGAVSWTPSFSQAGTYDVQFEIAGNGTSSIQPMQIVVKDVDAVPQFEKSGDKVVTAGETLSLNLVAKDADGGSPSYVLASPKLDGMTLNESTGSFSWVTKPIQAGSYIVVFRAMNGQDSKLYGEQSVVVTVNKSVSEPTAPTEVGTETTTSPEATPVQPAALAQPEAPAAPAEPAAPAIVSGCALIKEGNL